MRERSLVAAEEGRKPLIPRGDGEHPSAVAHGHDEKMHFDSLAADDHPGLPPIDLRLAPRRGLESDTRFLKGLFS